MTISCVVVGDTVVKAPRAGLGAGGLGAGGRSFPLWEAAGRRESGQEVNHPALCQRLVWACLVLGGICFILRSAVPWRAETFAEG